MSGDRPHILVLTGHVVDHHPVAGVLSEFFDVDVFGSMDEAMDALRRCDYQAVFADAGDFLPLERALVGQQASIVLDTIGEGVCVTDAEGVCRWSNQRMREYPVEVHEQIGAICRQARSIFTAQVQAASEQEGPYVAPSSRKFSFQTGDDRYYEVRTSPLLDEQREVRQIVGVIWDTTGGQRLQQKIDAIDAAGRELVRLDNEAISKLSPGGRLELLRDKIIRYSKDLMHFDHFAVRLLDKRSQKLEVVIAEGLPPSALDVDLYARPEGNGISGYVSATGRSYICHDTARDARYVPGIDNARSSLTVPLRLSDQVIGIYNIESESIGSFDEDDRQFAEMFAGHVGLALHILDLLVVERCTTTGRMADSVVQELAEPLNDVVTEAQSLLEEYIGDDTMRGRLNKIMDNVEAIRHTLKDVAAGPRAVLGTAKVDEICPDSALQGKRILIADDELSIRETIDSVLSRHGCTTMVCKDGHEAITLLQQEPVDLIVSDIKMPHRNGYDIFAAARRIREDFPVVLMTGFGYDPNHSIVRASQEGLSSVLFKPFRVEQLLDEIYKAMGVTPQAAEPNQD